MTWDAAGQGCGYRPSEDEHADLAGDEDSNAGPEIPGSFTAELDAWPDFNLPFDSRRIL